AKKFFQASRGSAARQQPRGVVIQDWCQPALGLRDRPAFTPRVILDLIAFDLADAEVAGLGVAEIEPAYRRARPHGEAFGQLDADPLAFEQAEQRSLLGMVWLGRVTRCGPDAAIFLGDDFGR